MVFVIAVKSVLWGDKYYLPEDGAFEVPAEVAGIWERNGSAEIVPEVAQEAPVEAIVEAAPIVPPYLEDAVETVETVDEILVSELDEIDLELAEKLESIGIFTKAELVSASVEELTAIKGIGKKKAEKILSAVKG